MYFLYSLALSLLFVALLPYFVYQAARHGKYAGSFIQRLGWLPESLRDNGQKTIWIHTVSVGEFVAARPLLERLNKDLSSHRIVVSTTTQTGQRLAQSYSKLFASVFYFPFDWKFSVRRALACISPSVVIILETELWPNFMAECRRRGVLVILANGRISQRSFLRYQRLGSFITRVLHDFSLLVMQSEADAERAKRLGARLDQVRVCGNLKYDLPGDEAWRASGGKASTSTDEPNPQPPTPNPYAEIDRHFALSATHHLIVAGSTAPDEESLLLAALRLVRNRPGLKDTRLVIAPRHPERFNEVANLIARSGFTFARRSQIIESPVEALATLAGLPGADGSSVSGLAGSPDVILLDSIGELAGIYRFATVVVVGGSLVPRGGHNIIEPAVFAKPIIVGPHTENFRQIVSDFEHADAVVQLRATGKDLLTDLEHQLGALLSDRERARAIGQRALNILKGNRGATECTLAAIKEIMGSPKFEVRSSKSVR